jgi:predicted TIM-barrel fold metal-dependent hydrolase
VEFANGAAAMAASGAFGDAKACAGIVGFADLRLGEAVEDVLAAHAQAAGGRYRGVRNSAAHEPGSEIGTPQLLLDRRFRAGFARLHGLGLSFDAFVRSPQLPELIDLARAFPETQIVLDHLGAPVRGARDESTGDERFARWRDDVRALAACENVAVKLGGPAIGMADTAALTSAALAAAWRPYFEICVEAFGAHRCMFESDYPASAGLGAYALLWNAFKRVAADASDAEKAALFSGTATRVYRLEL